jgi:hypothetical protein
MAMNVAKANPNVNPKRYNSRYLFILKKTGGFHPCL